MQLKSNYIKKKMLESNSECNSLIIISNVDSNSMLNQNFRTQYNEYWDRKSCQQIQTQLP